MSNCGCQETACALTASRDSARRRVLWTVLAINLVLFVGEFGAGWWGDSSALQADSLDSLGDALVYAMSLWAVGRSLRQRSHVVLLKGGIQALFGIGVLLEVIRRAWLGAEPLAPVMAWAAGLALVGNLVCFRLLTRFRSDDMNMRSVWLCSRNDLINNSGVLVAAGLVALTGSRWPDLVVGAGVAVLFLWTACSVLRGGWKDFRESTTTSSPTGLEVSDH
ncbi:MAG: cation transporter [Xanthomonadales bacterium]|nr:cation transporter [Xanthomonadales bacterium]